MSGNKFGVDIDYFIKELAQLAASMDNRTPDELARYLRRLADVADPSPPLSDNKELRDVLRRASIWMHRANGTIECGCEAEGHVCGKPELERDLREVDRILALLPSPKGAPQDWEAQTYQLAGAYMGMQIVANAARAFLKDAALHTHDRFGGCLYCAEHMDRGHLESCAFAKFKAEMEKPDRPAEIPAVAPKGAPVAPAPSKEMIISGLRRAVLRGYKAGRMNRDPNPQAEADEIIAGFWATPEKAGEAQANDQ